MNELAQIEKEFSGLATITPEKMQKITKRMVEVERANNTLGRKNTQTTNQLMTLTMLTDSPYRRLRQILAQIENKTNALRSNFLFPTKIKTGNKRMGRRRHPTFSYKGS